MRLQQRDGEIRTAAHAERSGEHRRGLPQIVPAPEPVPRARQGPLGLAAGEQHAGLQGHDARVHGRRVALSQLLQQGGAGEVLSPRMFQPCQRQIVRRFRREALDEGAQGLALLRLPAGARMQPRDLAQASGRGRHLLQCLQGADQPVRAASAALEPGQGFERGGVARPLRHEPLEEPGRAGDIAERGERARQRRHRGRRAVARGDPRLQDGRGEIALAGLDAQQRHFAPARYEHQAERHSGCAHGEDGKPGPGQHRGAHHGSCTTRVRSKVPT